MENILGYGKNAQYLFTQSKGAYVHSVYGKTINIKSEGKIFSLQPETVAKTPMAICISKESFSAIETAPREKLQFTPEGIYGFGVFWKRDTATLWDMTVQNGSCVERHYIEEIGAQVAKVIENNAYKGGFGNLALQLSTNQSPESGMIVEYAAGIISQMLVFASKGCWAEFAEECGKLVGVGVGLTPSGDDFLVGVLAAQCVLYNGNSKEALKKALHRGIGKKLDGTTEVSKEFLRYALENMFSEYILEGIEKIQKKEDVNDTLEKIAETGHSSGVDFLNGFFIGMKL